jgi:hypothetical protein
LWPAHRSPRAAGDRAKLVPGNSPICRDNYFNGLADDADVVDQPSAANCCLNMSFHILNNIRSFSLRPEIADFEA